MNFANASASVIGSSHYKLFYNNQDAYNFYQDQNCIIGVVADGCGSGAHSEAGAKLGVDFVVNFCKKYFRDKPFDAVLLKNALVEFLKNIVKNQQTNEELEFIENYLYFTLFGFMVRPEETTVFHSGDGLYQLNDKEVVIEQNNRPDYIAKNLISGEAVIETERIKTGKLQRLMISTDGLLHLNEAFSREGNIYQMTKIADFFENETHFDDMVSLPKLLTDLSVNRHILRDDTTMIMLRKSV